MTVNRLSEKNLIQIVAGETLKPATCIIKFYSNGCSYCHNLKEYYEQLADSLANDDTYFFAFNIDDAPVPKQISLNGVPTICKIKSTYRHRTRQKQKLHVDIQILKDPPNPDELTWYYPEDIFKFVAGMKK